RVIAFDHNVRNAVRAAGGEAGIRGPVPRTHNDFTARSGRERALAELTVRGLDTALLDWRFAIVNLWRPIGRRVEKWPLALAGAIISSRADRPARSARPWTSPRSGRSRHRARAGRHIHGAGRQKRS